ncbi:hypothetical protein E4U42_002618 [Claviceps africana]|uniref:Folliculin-interacting protein N-terminal domain-containing protein n=1 Tax=Claviceps africana TaxID=83212 RepID=A0A8K0JCM0_9HYPO|nr:hypothetical protein E4U42_002618 [Claviceps africana]
MLGKLLHFGTGGSAALSIEATLSGTSRSMPSLESVQEDIHTRNLLFPDVHALYHYRNNQVFPLSPTSTTPGSSTVHAFDYDEDLDLDVKDVRIIIMQDALGPANASLLFDSHPGPDLASTSERPLAFQDPRRAAMSDRKSSLTHSARPSVIPAEYSQPRQGAFDRRASLHCRSQSSSETESQRAAREYREELSTFSSCIFGNSELMAYKGTSTKVHVVPSEVRVGASAASSIFGEGRNSIGRSSGRLSKLSQSCSSQPISPTFGTGHNSETAHSRQRDKRTVLITRLFPVNLVIDDADSNTTPLNHCSEEDGGRFPCPSPGEDSAQRRKKGQPRQRRTPMYAVVLVVKIPSTTSRNSPVPPSKSLFRESGSYNDQDLFSSSYNSIKAGWNMSASGTSADTFDLEDGIDALTRHWDIIMRTLNHLQSLVATTIHAMLKRADRASPDPYPATSGPSHKRNVSGTSSTSDRRGSELPRSKPPKSTTKLVSLWPNCLANDVGIASEVSLARSRIVMGLRAARVVTGQGRWGIWRDEAIWTSKWAASSDRTAFFHSLLTGFLATHTDWIQALCGPSYGSRAASARLYRNEDDSSLPARTIIISDNKMAARRLVFLLSAFLPANRQIHTTGAHRPSTAASAGGYSNSPPMFIIPVLREESLRRKMNRQGGLRRASHSGKPSQGLRTSTASPQLPQAGIIRDHQRRASDVVSVRTMNLPMPGTDIAARKSSAATTSTIMTETTTPHFTSFQQRDAQRRQRTESSGSVAADDLKRSLRRADGSGQAGGVSRSPSSGLKWGGLIGGLWKPRRRDSIDSIACGQGNADLRSPVKPSFGRIDKVSEMAQEPSKDQVLGNMAVNRQRGDARDVCSSRPSFTGVRSRELSAQADAQADRTPDPNGAFESSFTTSINVEDGVIDVDIPFPDYITSFESAISSPSSSGYSSTPGLSSGMDAFEQTRFAIDGDLPLNTVGWLNSFHPDFALQAIPPQDKLMEKVKAAMRAEPTPAPISPQEEAATDRWVDVSRVVVANTVSNTVSRIVYKRLVRSHAVLDHAGTHTGAVGPNRQANLTPSVLPYETQLEEEWLEESILSYDESLKHAVDRVVCANGNARKASSINSLQSPSSNAHVKLEGDSTTHDALSETKRVAKADLVASSAPRTQCMTVILSALEDMIREAVENRHGGGNMGLTRNSRHDRQHRSILRDAVQDWVAGIDTVELT